MRKFNSKLFIFIFTVLFVIQFALVLGDVYLSKAQSELSSITSLLISIFSLPIGLINSNLPFYVAEDLYMRILYWILNVSIQTMLIYGALRVFSRLKNHKRI